MPKGYQVNVSREPRYVGALQYMMNAMGTSGGPPIINDGGMVSDYQIRETTYIADMLMDMDDMGIFPADLPGVNSHNTRRAQLARSIDEMIAVLENYCNGDHRFTNEQYFFDGFILHSLARGWAKHKDPRVLMVMKEILDRYWADYNLAGHKPMWGPWPTGVLCASNCLNNTSDNTTDLANFMAPIFAWYWRVSGDNTYQTRGDEVFSHEFDDPAFCCSNGKTFAQAYRYSFDFVGLRQGWLSPDKFLE